MFSMDSSHFTPILFILSLLRSVGGQNCTVEPLVLPYGNVTLRSGVQSFGVPLTLGGQNFALKPTSNQDITYVFSVPQDCVDAQDPIACAKDPDEGAADDVYVGGVFDTKASGTYRGPLRWSSIGGGRKEDTSRGERFYGYETIDFGDTLLDDFLFVSSDKSQGGDLNYLGLGKNSTILNALYDVGKIPSKIWGFWGGWTGSTEDTIQEGSLVLGGYDKSKIAGSFASYDMIEDERNCKLRVSVNDIKLRGLNGVETSVFQSGMTMDACVNPTFNSMSLPRDIVDSIAKTGDLKIDDANRSGGLYTWGFTVPTSDNAGFSLIFDLGNIKITIPNHQLFHPYRFTTESGYNIVNGSEEQVLQINALQDINKNDLSQLGWPFLSSAYILVEPEEQTFRIAQAVQSIVTTTSIVPVMASSCATGAGTMSDIPIASSTFSGGARTSATSSPSDGSSPSNSNSQTPIGPIVGGVVGAIALLSAAAVFWFFLNRRYKLKILSSASIPPRAPPYEVEGTELQKPINAGGYDYQNWGYSPSRKPLSIYEMQ